MPTRDLIFVLSVDDQGTIVVKKAVGDISTTLQAAGQQAGETSNKFKKLKQDVDNSSGSFTKALEGVRGFGQGMFSMGRQMTFVMAAITGGLVLATRSTISLAAELHQLSIKTGMSTEDLSSLRLTVQKSGVSFDLLATGLKWLSINMAKSQKEGSETERVFQKLKVSAIDIHTKAFRPIKDVLFDMAKAFAGIRNESTRTQLAIKVFGRTGDELVKFLLAFAKSGEADIEMVKKMGAIISTQFGVSADELQAKMAMSKLAVQGLYVTIGEHVVPVLTEFILKIVDVVKHIKTWLDQHPKTTKFLTEWGTKFIILMTAMSPLMMTLGRLLSIGSSLVIIFPRIAAKITLMTVASRTAASGMGAMSASLGSIITILTTGAWVTGIAAAVGGLSAIIYYTWQLIEAQRILKGKTKEAATAFVDAQARVVEVGFAVGLESNVWIPAMNEYIKKWGEVRFQVEMINDLEKGVFGAEAKKKYADWVVGHKKVSNAVEDVKERFSELKEKFDLLTKEDLKTRLKELGEILSFKDLLAPSEVERVLKEIDEIKAKLYEIKPIAGEVIKIPISIEPTITGEFKSLEELLWGENWRTKFKGSIGGITTDVSEGLDNLKRVMDIKGDKLGEPAIASFLRAREAAAFLGVTIRTDLVASLEDTEKAYKDLLALPTELTLEAQIEIVKKLIMFYKLLGKDVSGLEKELQRLSLLTMKFFEKFYKVMGQVQNLIGAMGAAFNQIWNNQLIAIDNEYKARKTAIDKSMMDDEKKYFAIETLDREMERRRIDIMRKQAAFEKLNAIASAIMNTAVAITKALPNLVLATIIGILGAIQVAAIIATPLPSYARGGVVEKEGPAYVHRGEIISPISIMKETFREVIRETSTGLLKIIIPINFEIGEYTFHKQIVRDINLAGKNREITIPIEVVA